MDVCGVRAGMQAKPYRRVDYSHSSVQLLKISHDNQLLVNHLTTISKAVRYPFMLTCRVGAGAQRPIVCMQQLQKAARRTISEVDTSLLC